MSIAKAALERLTIEMAYELGRDFGIRANCVRFSPYMEVKQEMLRQKLKM